jgi:hypothetical protein
MCVYRSSVIRAAPGWYSGVDPEGNYRTTYRFIKSGRGRSRVPSWRPDR